MEWSCSWHFLLPQPNSLSFVALAVQNIPNICVSSIHIYIYRLIQISIYYIHTIPSQLEVRNNKHGGNNLRLFQKKQHTTPARTHDKINAGTPNHKMLTLLCRLFNDLHLPEMGPWSFPNVRESSGIHSIQWLGLMKLGPSYYISPLPTYIHLSTLQISKAFSASGGLPELQQINRCAVLEWFFGPLILRSDGRNSGDFRNSIY